MMEKKNHSNSTTVTGHMMVT